MKASERAKLLSYRSPQPLNHTYYKIQHDYTTNKLREENEAHTRLITTQPLEGIAKHSKTGYQYPARSRKLNKIESSQKRLEQKDGDRKGLLYWNQQDFSQTPIPTSKEMFGNTKDFRERAGMDAHSPSERYHIFEPAWSEWYNSDEPDDLQAHIKSQTDLLDATYNTYVKERSSSRIVQMWTSGMEKGQDVPPPHKMMEYTLLSKAFKHKATDEQVKIDNKRIEELYDLVTEAPRCPDMMSFIRVVRNRTRLPQFWFELKHKQEKEMQFGDSIVLPVFMSTSNTDLESSWMAQGPDSFASEVDEFDKNKGVGSKQNCCLIQVIVSKGTPMLPLGDFDINRHQHENEILLPPGIELVLLSEDVAEINEQNLTIYTFITRVSASLVTLVN